MFGVELCSVAEVNDLMKLAHPVKYITAKAILVRNESRMRVNLRRRGWRQQSNSSLVIVIMTMKMCHRLAWMSTEYRAFHIFEAATNSIILFLSFSRFRKLQCTQTDCRAIDFAWNQPTIQPINQSNKNSFRKNAQWVALKEATLHMNCVVIQ